MDLKAVVPPPLYNFIMIFMMAQINVLPATPGVKESFIGQFLKQMKLKALALAKYVDAEPLVYMITSILCCVGYLHAYCSLPHVCMRKSDDVWHG